MQHKTLKDHFERFLLVHENLKHNIVWKDVWATIIWSIWKQRNKIIFKQGKVDMEEIFHMAHVEQDALMSPNPREKLEDLAAGCVCCVVV